MPRGLNVQALLYIPGAQAIFNEPVTRVEYLFFRGKDGRPHDIETDSVVIAPAGSPADDDELSTEEVARAQIEIAASVARMLASGEMTAFATATDTEACRFCEFIAACPGALAVAP
jgi:hypothetical protein